ncbi:MAG TPA: signal peptidase II [Roseiarcus sp.]|nr:signal peptidase II [Roseiarcus sp.]
MNPRALGVAIAVATLVADQAIKAAVLLRLPEGPSTALAPFLNLTLRWNQGVSFSLFTQDSASGKATLLALTLAATALLAWWLSRARSYLVATGLGAIIGGALGNAADRATHGAVVDFLDLHAFGKHFFVFNLADAAINVGVALLLIDLIFGVHHSDEKKRPISQNGRG